MRTKESVTYWESPGQTGGVGRSEILSHVETQYAQAVTETIREHLEDKIKAQKPQKQLFYSETEYEEVASTLSEAQEKLNSSKVKI